MVLKVKVLRSLAFALRLGVMGTSSLVLRTLLEGLRLRLLLRSSSFEMLFMFSIRGAICSAKFVWDLAYTSEPLTD